MLISLSKPKHIWFWKILTSPCQFDLVIHIYFVTENSEYYRKLCLFVLLLRGEAERTGITREE